MKRVALLCLLTLTACQPDDPRGTVQPDDKGHLQVEVREGDSAPFRLPEGDVSLSLLTGKDSTMDLMADCKGDLTLMTYSGEEVRRFEMTNPYAFLARVNAVDAGVYFLRLEPNSISCAYTAFVSSL